MREERVVRVHSMSHTITVSHTSKAAWIAIGDYMGKRVEVMGSSADNAARRWVAAARCKDDEREVHRRVSQ